MLELLIGHVVLVDDCLDGAWVTAHAGSHVLASIRYLRWHGLAGVPTKCCQSISAGLTALEWRLLVREELTQHVLQDAAMLEVGSLGRCVDPYDHLQLSRLPAVPGGDRHAFRNLDGALKPNN